MNTAKLLVLSLLGPYAACSKYSPQTLSETDNFPTWTSVVVVHHCWSWSNTNPFSHNFYPGDARLFGY